MSSAVSIAAALLALSVVLAAVYLSQRYWFGHLWGLAGRVRHSRTRIGLRLICLAGAVVVFAGAVLWVLRLRDLLPWPFFAVLGLWLMAGFFGWLGIKVVHGLERGWERLLARRARRRGAAHLPSPARRHFFQRAAYFAGAAPFVGAAYGFLAERRWFRVEQVEAPIAGLPEALDGLRILQLSDIHIGSYMTREHVRRAVELTGGLDPHLVALTGDFITWQRDPIEACVEELAVLRAPLGVWGCNGNHETYAGMEARAAELFRQAGFQLLRQANAELEWRGARLNVIGVDHQATRPPVGEHLPMLLGAEALVRPDAFNLLLSHNPNAFPRAAGLGIGLTLAGHTHGGQIQLELLHPWLNPARFITPFVAGLYSLPVGAGGPSTPTDGVLGARHSSLVTASLYVNRGLGTVGAPIRVGAPPEITLLILRRA
jgi:predicted MPP superfamily phosphohydrolase